MGHMCGTKMPAGIAGREKPYEMARTFRGISVAFLKIHVKNGGIENTVNENGKKLCRKSRETD